MGNGDNGEVKYCSDSKIRQNEVSISENGKDIYLK